MGKAELRMSIDEQLVERARRAGIDLDSIAADAVSEAIGRALAIQGASEEAAAWAAENEKAIRAYEARIERIGIFGEDFRTW